MTSSQEAREATPEAAVVPETPPDAASLERPAETPDRSARAQRAAAQPDVPQDGPPPIPTGFPETPPSVAPQPAKQARPGFVTLAVRPPVGELTIPPLEGGGEVVTITPDGTEVDDATAARAHEAARLAGFTLRET